MFQRNSDTSIASIASSLSGGLTSITAGGNIAIEGAHLAGTDGVMVAAGGALAIAPSRDTASGYRSTSSRTSGFGLGGGSMPMVVPIAKSAQDSADFSSDTAAATTIQSSQGGVLLQGGTVYMQGVQVEANKDITVLGEHVAIVGSTDYRSGGTAQERKNLNAGTETWWRDPGTGIDAKNIDTTQNQSSSPSRTTLNGANVSLTATRSDGTLTLGGTTVNTPGTLFLGADTLHLATQSTYSDTSKTSKGRDLAWQRAKGEGTSAQATTYDVLNAGKLEMQATHVVADSGATQKQHNGSAPGTPTAPGAPPAPVVNVRDSMLALSTQPGMGWIDQLAHDPKYDGKIDWAKVNEVHNKWDYAQQGLTPEGAIIVTIIVTYFTWGAASGVGAAAGSAAGGGMTGTVVAGAVTAGVSALAGQAAVAAINNKGDLGGTLHDLGSSQNVHGLLTAIITGGVLAGLNLNPTGQATANSGTQQFMDQLGQNLKAGAARALINTAINGGSLEDNLKNSLKTALIDTAAAQGANAIGDLTQAGTLNSFTNKVAHAIAGCVAGVARADNSGGCGPGALGASVGELVAESYGKKADTVQFATMISGIAAAAAGMNASQIGIASAAGGNAAANNFVSHSPYAVVRDIIAKENARLTKACSANCQIEDFRLIDLQMQQLEAAATMLEGLNRSALTAEQATRIGNLIIPLLPLYGTPVALYQALSGENLSGDMLTNSDRFFSALAGAAPLGSLASKAFLELKAAASTEAEMKFTMAHQPVGEIGKDLLLWGRGQSATDVAKTLSLTKSLSSESIENLISQGLSKEWVESQLKQYLLAQAIGGEKLVNVQLIPRINLMQKLLALWPK